MWLINVISTTCVLHSVGGGCSVVVTQCNKKKDYLWQSCVEIEGYSIMYFDRIAVFEVLYR